MGELIFHWLAIFSDGTYINQFTGEQENQYLDVQNRSNELKLFILYNVNTHEEFHVDLEKGIIYKESNFISFTEENTKKNIRLIYFRRWRRTFDAQGNQIKAEVHYFLGLQYNTEDNKNKQILLEIDENGNFILGE